MLSLIFYSQVDSKGIDALSGYKSIPTYNLKLDANKTEQFYHIYHTAVLWLILFFVSVCNWPA